ncbi:Nose resistant to fluoxetine protein 6 [Araneus ventricosus]|uniref:Nose resistant to fluoxetine protein 6 n=1 Tax=Araneus ventricosus TaxID=182803 RepID=A0A4Y2UB86_ARAVE|nr:Nose resistant to fluoxetine protein 6 [Araneus ventricosus]
MASFLCITYITGFVISYKYNLVTGLANIASKFSDINQFIPQWAEYFTKFYIKPYTRLDPYLIGIALAYLLFRRKQSNAGKLNLMTLSGGWAIASGVTFTCLFGLYHQNPSMVASSFYNALNRTGFACGLAWVIFVCINDQGGVVNSILSCKLLIPLSRLTFCAYLLHPIIEIVYFSTVRRLIEFSHTILERDPGLLLATLKQGHVSYIIMFLLSSPYEASRYLVGKDIVFCQTIAAMMGADSLQKRVYNLEPLSCRYKNANCQTHWLPSNPTPSQNLL